MMTFIAAKKTKQTDEPVPASAAIQGPAPAPKQKLVSVKKISAPKPNSIVEYKDPEEEEVDEGEFDEEEVPEDGGYDCFELKTGGAFNKDEVLKIELPKFMVKTDIKNVCVIEDKSTVMLTLIANEYN